MKKRAIQYALLFLLSGLVLTVILAYIQKTTSRIYDENQPYIRLGETVKSRVMRAHLNLEEIAGGETSLNHNGDVTALLNSSMLLLEAAYDGKETELGSFSKTNDEELRAMIKETLLAIEKLKGLAEEQRIQQEQEPRAVLASATDSSFIATPVPAVVQVRTEDKDFNLLFDQVLFNLDKLVLRVDNSLDEGRKTVRIYYWVSLVFLTAVSGGLSFLVFLMQFRSDKLATENNKRLADQEHSVQEVSAFIEAVSAGNFKVELNLGGDNHLGRTLLDMRNKLQENADNDRTRNWSTSGLAQIGDILRAHSSSTTELYDNIIRFVVKYTKSNQGGLFLLNDESEADKYLELCACYAFERKKFLQKKVVPGEGLVGQCYLEGERIYLIEVPQEYISITSGLGASNPNALLIVPLKVNEKSFGVLELATFGKYEDFEIELVEKFAETIASTISTVRINDSTRILLEKTQQQAEEMRAQEEEMRQNMEELEATQEEMRRKEKHIQEMLEHEKLRGEFNNKNRQMVLELSKAQEIIEGHWEKALEKITRMTGNALEVSRVSVWAYDSTSEKLVLEKTFCADTATFEKGLSLSRAEYPGFIEAILGEKTISANDIATTAETKELVSVLGERLRIRSLLSVPYFYEGKVAGIISCEHQHREKQWSDDYTEILKSCSELITVTMNTVRINKMVGQLSDARETMQTIIDNLPRAVFWKDRELRIQGCNRIFAAVAGVKSPHELIGKTDFEMPWKQHAEAYRADDLSVMNSRESRLNQEERNVNSDGAESWVLTSKVPIIGKDGDVVAVLGMFEDITDRKRREVEMNDRIQELKSLKKKLEIGKN